MLDPNFGLQINCTAIAGCERLKLFDTLPLLRQMAESENVDHNTRVVAIDAVVALADKKGGEITVVNLLGSQVHSRVNEHAIYRAVENDFRKAILKLIDLLDEPNFDRKLCDRALRILCNRPQGVGFDPANPKSELWRNWAEALK